jgi:hypothetical protein
MIGATVPEEPGALTIDPDLKGMYLHRIRHRGVPALEEISPDWLTMVDLSVLDMRLSRWCVLGQVARELGKQYNDLCPGSLWALAQGFEIDLGLIQDRQVAWRTLEDAWIDVITELREESGIRA